MQEQFIDLSKQTPYTIKGLIHTPGAALGSIRYKIQQADYEQIIAILEKYNIRYFFYAGGNDSMDTASKVSAFAKDRGYELTTIGIPKTIDNDLPFTDHCPGYGSAAKYLAITTCEVWLDTSDLPTTKVVLLETMGRNTGWLAGATALAKKASTDGPHLIYLPEIPFSANQFITDVESAILSYGSALVVVSEGIAGENGSHLVNSCRKDAFGHCVLEGCAAILKAFVEKNLGVKARSIVLASAQRAAAHLASKTDINEAFLVGSTAVNYALAGISDVMVTLERKTGEEYVITTGTIPLSKVANCEKKIPREWINTRGNYVTKEFIQYVQPLIKGEPTLFFQNGIPVYIRLR